MIDHVKLSTPDVCHCSGSDCDPPAHMLPEPQSEPYLKPVDRFPNVFETPNAMFVGVNPETNAETLQYRTPTQAAEALRNGRYAAAK